MRELEGRAEALAGTFIAQDVANTLWASSKAEREPRKGPRKVFKGMMRGMSGMAKDDEGRGHTQELSSLNRSTTDILPSPSRNKSISFLFSPPPSSVSRSPLSLPLPFSLSLFNNSQSFNQYICIHLYHFSPPSLIFCGLLILLFNLFFLHYLTPPPSCSLSQRESGRKRYRGRKKRESKQASEKG
jgi:hypothetical protein